ASFSRVSNWSGESTTRIPRPPPPNAALMIRGKPIFSAARRASSGSLTGSGVPGTIGTPARSASFLAAVLSQQFQQFDAWAHKGDAVALACSGQIRIFRKKSVARMNQIDALFLRQRHDVLDSQ